ncbi:type ISP restriction/modification enzyme [Methylobacterium sp. ARG-1]|uniref:type ISP restriction/modification enzyme n=1 Tax=Methylobacterium sp. ARG-1 TaxID=1692501 RepID=UPI0009EA1542|nr:type ISP restriction/modification enzyme [Methylobacterium sp. ARG-1]
MKMITAYLDAIQKALVKGDATEHTHRPALKTLLETFDPDILATNEPKRIACGAPDFVISEHDLVLGYIEAKDVGIFLTDTLRTDQLKRYLRSLDNIILTDYIEFRWFTGGEHRATVRLGTVTPDGKITPAKDVGSEFLNMLSNFRTRQPQTITSPKSLAERMARLTHIIRDVIVTSFENNEATPWIRQWRKAFADVLIADLNQPKRTSEFADMFAQTLSYGLFTARVMTDKSTVFNRTQAQRLIPRSNPFLRNFFMDISSLRLDDEPFSSFVEDLVRLLTHTDMQKVLADFGRRTRQEDPIVHFYETFLAAYDPSLREKRGVYYTPEPVVSYIVRSVDEILKRDFDCPKGLADQTYITVKNLDTSLRVKGKDTVVRKTTQSHKVLILDPAVGTGTFLYSVIDFIRQQFIDAGNAGLWRGYVSKHLLPRLFGFEFMVAPYAVAHFKISLQLLGYDLPEQERLQWAYEPQDGERIGVYLTNTLDEAHPETPMPLFTQYVAEESSAANEIKLHRPVLVVMGNPPYSGHSANRGDWMDDLQKGKIDPAGVPSYYMVDGQPLKERNSKWLKNDYVKFLSFGQWRIARNGEGVLAFITDHGYIDNPTFRGMRQSLLSTFSEIYVLDLHGGAKKKEKTPDGGIDENVFDIMQGVSIAIFIKRRDVMGPAKVFHLDLWGLRSQKYDWLAANSLKSTKWESVTPQAPFYLFRPQEGKFTEQYQLGWKLTDIFPVNVLGFQTHRDRFAIDFDAAQIERRIGEMRDTNIQDAVLHERYGLKDNRDWQLSASRKALQSRDDWMAYIVECDYRPFDRRYCYFSYDVMDYPRRELIEHVAGKENICLLAARQQAIVGFRHAWVSTNPAESCVISSTTREQNYVFPLYVYPVAGTSGVLDLERVWPRDSQNRDRAPNISHGFIDALTAMIGMEFDPKLIERDGEFFGPEDVLGYIYAVLNAPTYRAAYAPDLKIDFPRIPLPSSGTIFCHLADLGRELVGLHTMNNPAPQTLPLRYPVAGDNVVVKQKRRYILSDSDGIGRIFINDTQYFEGIPVEVWEYEVGGFQIADKWLKDRVGRALDFDELGRYQNMLNAINRTISATDEIDELYLSETELTA